MLYLRGLKEVLIDGERIAIVIVAKDLDELIRSDDERQHVRRQARTIRLHDADRADAGW